MFKGTATVELVVGGKVVSSQEVDNTFMYEGADITGLVLAGKRAPPAFAYLEFYNGASPGGLPTDPVDRAEGKSYYDGLAADETPDRDYIRVPILFAPATGASSADYVSNVCRFLVTSDGAPSEGKAGLSFGNAAASTVYGAAIVCAGATEAEDLVFARLYPTPVAVPADGAVHIRWNYTVT